jgi:hypothetical protein
LTDEFDRIRQVLADFLPVQVRVVFVADPLSDIDTYDTLNQVVESGSDNGVPFPPEP